MQVTLGTQVEVDTATPEKADNSALPSRRKSSARGGMATLPQRLWTPPAATLELPTIFPDDIEVLVFSEVGPPLAGAIELVSPRNKDRPRARRAFASKCLTYLQRGVGGGGVVDVVTERKANLHDELARLLGRDAALFPGKPTLYTTAYRPYRRDSEERLAVWTEVLAVGQPMPAMPLWLLREPNPVRVDLEVTYTEARQKSRLE